MMLIKHKFFFLLKFLLIAVIMISACQPVNSSSQTDTSNDNGSQTSSGSKEISTAEPIQITPFPTRQNFSPGELVDYVAQSGDTLPALAAHFNSSVEEIRQANPVIPEAVTTMPPGMPMKIPIYFRPFWGSPYQIMPDSLFINGPAQVGFNSKEFVETYPGWLSSYSEYAAGATRSGSEIVDFVALKFSVSPRLLIALVEYQSAALTQSDPSEQALQYPLGYPARDHKALYLQLVWTANALNNGYYGWRSGNLTSIEHRDGDIMHFDPWQNASSVALQYFFNLVLSNDEYLLAVSPEGFAQTYEQLFGDAWYQPHNHIPGSLQQPSLSLPFEPGFKWAFTGGPHTAWGQGEPLAALDFAPPATIGGCQPTSEWTTAIAQGVIARSETGELVLDLDEDGDERTGWNIYYLHISTGGRASLGTRPEQGEPIGHPSCEGGSSTGTHIHIARKYNGEWIQADGPLAFNLNGWIAHNGSEPYLGTLTRLSQTITACECSNQDSMISNQEE